MWKTCLRLYKPSHLVARQVCTNTFKSFEKYGSCSHVVGMRYYSVKGSQYPSLAFPEEPLASLFLARFEKYGDNLALVDNTNKKEMTYNELCKQIRKCSSALYKLGVRKGHVVSVCSTNCVEYIVIMYAVTACGAAFAMSNPLYTEEEQSHHFSVLKPDILFASTDVIDRYEKMSADMKCSKHVFTIAERSGYVSFDSLLATGDEQGISDEVVIDVKNDVSLLPSSSGTTGLPKAVMLTHYNCICVSECASFHFNFIQSSRCYGIVPMFHIIGFGVILSCMRNGARYVFDERFTLDGMLQAFQDHKITHTIAVPPIVLALARSPLVDKYDISSLKLIVSGGAPLANTLVSEIKDRLKVSLVQVYGMTEGVPVSCGDKVNTPLASVGNISPNTTVKIVDITTGKVLGPGEEGEIRVKTPTVMKGYYNNPEATAQSFDSDGWLCTGDVGYYDDDSMLYVVDRVKELIKYKGFQVPPAEIEAALLKHPKVLDVCVIGVPDFEAGELPKAFVVKKDPSLTEEEVTKYINDMLSSYKHLRGGVEFIEMIPKTQSGKLLRRELRKRK